MSRRNPNGFSLIELLVATTILGVAVAALLSGFSGSLSNLARVTEYDRAALDAKQKMEELLADTNAPRMRPIGGQLAEGRDWQARIVPQDFAYLPPSPGSAVVDRIELQVSWPSGRNRRSIKLEGYRRAILRPEDFSGTEFIR